MTDIKHTSEILVGQWAAAVLSLIATQASASDCYLRADLIKELATKYDEVQVARAMEARGGMVEIYAAPSGSWTMVVIPPDIGDFQACIVATGGNWTMFKMGEVH